MNHQRSSEKVVMLLYLDFRRNNFHHPSSHEFQIKLIYPSYKI
ncbi:hypothetical protein MCC93_19330 [Morococcus cerebrosus]|uniref:Uncharacterized protein n=1 Tax=Morococcus cerebrosus TaxID=1056807 RepID=A0A0C1GJG3_9NEIS|nr:hypothetical protein MCC93_19330 [Morococcus cerebrosus]